MALQNFVDYIGPKIAAAWLNGVDKLKFTVFADAVTKTAARLALTSDAPLEIANGGTGSRTGALTPYFGITPAETAALVTPTYYYYEPGDVRRYGAIGDNATDCRTAIQAAIDVAKNTSLGGGEVYLPKGKYKITGALNLSGMFFTNQIRMRGEGKYETVIFPAFNGTSVLDLSGSVLCSLSEFGIRPVATFKQDQVILCARLASNNSAGNHKFDNLWIEGTCNNATVVLWGSEENQFYSCLLWSNVDKPALVMAVKMSEAGFTPTSTFQTLGTGQGGVGMNGFFGCRFGNETGVLQTVPLLRLYGTLGSNFQNCFFACYTPHTIEINHSTYPSDASNAYPCVLTFDTCSDEDAWGLGKKNSIHIIGPFVAAKYAVKGLAIRNCQFFDIYAEDGSYIDGLVYEGGKYSNSIPAPSGSKLSVYQMHNSTIAPSRTERAMTYTVRNQGSANFFRAIDAGNIALGTDTTSSFIDAAGNLLNSGYLLTKSPTGGLGYSAGAGGTVTQIMSSSTAVTLDKPVGRIITVALTTVAGAEEVFQVNNSVVTSLDIIAVSTTYSGGGTPAVSVKGVATGGFVIVITNLHSANALDAVVIINFAVIRGITS